MMSISVVSPSVNAKPRTSPSDRMYSSSAARNDTVSDTRMVRRALAQPRSTAARSDLPSRTSSRNRSKYTMNESAVMPIATISPAMPASVSVNPSYFDSRTTDR